MHLLASVLDNAMHNIVQNNNRLTSRFDENGGGGDWEAIWAFALGPEPELALSLRYLAIPLLLIPHFFSPFCLSICVVCVSSSTLLPLTTIFFLFFPSCPANAAQ